MLVTCAGHGGMTGHVIQAIKPVNADDQLVTDIIRLVTVVW